MLHFAVPVYLYWYMYYPGMCTKTPCCLHVHVYTHIPKRYIIRIIQYKGVHVHNIYMYTLLYRVRLYYAGYVAFCVILLCTISLDMHTNVFTLSGKLTNLDRDLTLRTGSQSRQPSFMLSLLIFIDVPTLEGYWTTTWESEIPFSSE